MAIDFPNSPTIGQTYTSTTGQTYTWNGTAWRVLVPGSQMSRTTFTATAGQTTFSMNYTPGFIDVYRNGVKLVSGADFTATDAATIVLVNGCNVGDTLEVMSIAQVAYTDAAKAEDVYSVVRGMKNRIINGDMRIDQRNAGASVSITSGSVYTLDRYEGAVSSTGRFSVQRSTSAPSGFTNSALLTVTTTLSPSATDYHLYQQKIEGLNIADLGWGTASASAITVSFWVKGSVAGTYSYYALNAATNMSYVTLFTINSVNTWEYKTITIPGPTSGTWNTDSTVGIYTGFNLGVGSSRQTTAGTWTSGASFYLGTSSTVQFINNSGATLNITGWQLEAGTVTNPVFERRPYGLELHLCQRYFQIIQPGGAGRESYKLWDWRLPVTFPTTMRSTPTAALVGTPTFSNTNWIVLAGSSPTGGLITIGMGGSDSVWNDKYVTMGSAYFTLSAEL